MYNTFSHSPPYLTFINLAVNTGALLSALLIFIDYLHWHMQEKYLPFLYTVTQIHT